VACIFLAFLYHGGSPDAVVWTLPRLYAGWPRNYSIPGRARDFFLVSKIFRLACCPFSLIFSGYLEPFPCV